MSQGLVINISYDSSVAGAPVGFTNVVNSVVQYYESIITNPITLNIDVGYGEIAGQRLSSGDLGESLGLNQTFSYSQIRNALIANATSSNQLQAVSTLPSSAPANGSYVLTLANATALGLISGSTTLDGYVGFSSTTPFAFSNTNGVPANQYDFFGDVAHEISEVLGRVSYLDTFNSYSIQDLYRYAAPGVRALSSNHSTAYFSINGGVTNLDNFNTNPNGDFGDWATSVPNDSFDAFSSPGVVNAVSTSDLIEMNVLGYNLSATAIPPTVTAIAEAPSSGDLNIGKTVVLTLDFSEPVTVTGAPTLALNDHGIATYAGGSGTGAIAFNYTVAAGDAGVSTLTATAVNLDGGSIVNGAGTNAQLSLTGLAQAGPQIDATIPAVSAVVEQPSSGVLNAGATVTITLDLSEAVTVTGAPTLTLNDGATATYSSGSGSSALTFSYTVAVSDAPVAALAVSSVNPNGGTIADSAGNTANLTLAGLTQAGPQIDTNVNFVAQNYEFVLLRQPAASESSFWANLLDTSALTRPQLVADFVTSPEAQDLVLPVARFYVGLFDRAPDAGGLDFWVSELRGGLPLGIIAADFVNSPEFQQRYSGDATPTEFVTALYQNVLGRPPDSAGEQAWVNFLTQNNDSAAAQATAAFDFATSPEFVGDSTAEINAWLTTAGETGAYPATISGTAAAVGASEAAPSGLSASHSIAQIGSGMADATVAAGGHKFAPSAAASVEFGDHEPAGVPIGSNPADAIKLLGLHAAADGFATHDTLAPIAT